MNDPIRLKELDGYQKAFESESISIPQFDADAALTFIQASEAAAETVATTSQNVSSTKTPISAQQAAGAAAKSSGALLATKSVLLIGLVGAFGYALISLNSDKNEKVDSAEESPPMIKRTHIEIEDSKISAVKNATQKHDVPIKTKAHQKKQNPSSNNTLPKNVIPTEDKKHVTQLKTKQQDDDLEKRERLNEVEKDHGLNLYDNALSALKRRDYPTAIRFFKDYLEAYPTGHLVIESRFSLIEAYYQHGDYPKVLQQSRLHLAKADYRKSDVQRMMLSAYEQLGQCQAAQVFAKKFKLNLKKCKK